MKEIVKKPLLSTSSISVYPSEKGSHAYNKQRLRSLQVSKIQMVIQRAQKGLLEAQNGYPALCASTREAAPSLPQEPFSHEFKNSELHLLKMQKRWCSVLPALFAEKD